jgi:hypothetical protein
MEKPKKKKNKPKTEIHWDVIEKQYGEITTHPIVAQLQEQKPERLLPWLARELDFGQAEVKANSVGKMTLKQRRKLVMPYVYGSHPLVYFVVGTTVCAMLSISFNRDVFFVILFTLVISSWFILIGRHLSRHRTTIQYEKAYLLPYQHLRRFILVASDNPVHASSWELTIPVSEELHAAFKGNRNLYHIYYTDNTKTVLSVEPVEETDINQDLA